MFQHLNGENLKSDNWIVAATDSNRYSVLIRVDVTHRMMEFEVDLDDIEDTIFTQISKLLPLFHKNRLKTHFYNTLPHLYKVTEVGYLTQK